MDPQTWLATKLDSLPYVSCSELLLLVLRVGSSASSFACSGGQVDLYKTKATLNQVEATQNNLNGVTAEILETKQVLVAAEEGAVTAWWGKQLEQLREHQNLLLAHKTVVLQSQAQGQLCPSSRLFLRNFACLL